VDIEEVGKRRARLQERWRLKAELELEALEEMGIKVGPIETRTPQEQEEINRALAKLRIPLPD
jgi:hypothetical protein